MAGYHTPIWQTKSDSCSVDLEFLFGGWLGFCNIDQVNILVSCLFRQFPETTRSVSHHQRSIPAVVVQSLSHVRLCDPMDCSMRGFSVLHYLSEFAQIYIHGVSGTI